MPRVEDRIMTTTIPFSPMAGKPPVVLQNGDRLSQKEFHALYNEYPDHVRAELIGGIVYMASPLRARHGRNHAWFTTAFVYYEGHTPQVEVYDNTTIILDEDNEPQPDLHVRLQTEYGGQTTVTADGYIEGAPEFVCEISDSTRSLDLNSKRIEYQNAGVLEYIVLNIRDNRVHWFDFANNIERFADSDNIIRLRTFPGLWIDTNALLERNLRRILSTIDDGLASPEHAEFVKRLASRKVDRPDGTT